MTGQITPPEMPTYYNNNNNNNNPQRLSGGSFPSYNVPVTGYSMYAGYNSIASPTPHRLSNPGIPMHLQNSVSSPFNPQLYPFATQSHIGNRF